MATNTAILALRKPDGPDFVNRTLDLNNNWDILDALFHTTTGHKHTGAGTNGPNLLLSQSTEVDDDATEAATLDTLTGSTRLIANLNRIRYYLTQISGQSLGTVTTSLNTHATSFHATGFASPAIVLGTAAAAGVATSILRSDATIVAFDATVPVTQAVGDAAATGSIALAARRDHRHGFPGTATPVTQAYSDAADAGVAVTISRSDHRHGMPASTPTTFAVPAILLGTSAAAGVATTAIRSDSTIIAFDAVVPTTQAFADAAAVGSATIAARRDHKHGMMANPQNFVTPAITLSTAAAAGTGTDVIRANAAIAAFDASAPPNIATASAVGAINFAARRDHTHGHGALAAITSAHAAADITNAASLIAVNTFTKQYLVTRFGVTFSATPTFDWDNSNVQSMTLTGNITTMTLTNAKDGGRYVLIFTQDGTGGRTIAWPAAVKWSGGVAPTLSGANKIDVVGLVWNGTSYFASIGTNY